MLLGQLQMQIESQCAYHAFFCDNTDKCTYNCVDEVSVERVVLSHVVSTFVASSLLEALETEV